MVASVSSLGIVSLPLSLRDIEDFHCLLRGLVKVGTLTFGFEDLKISLEVGES